MKRITIHAMIAAAGKSERMGYPKALIPIGDVPAIRFSIRSLRAISPNRIIVTLPWPLMMNERLRLDLVMHSVHIMPNRFMDLGYKGSIKTVVHETPEDVAGIIVNPVDAPLYSQPLLVAMVNLATSLLEESVIIVPYFFTKAGHPVYLSRHFFMEFARPKDPMNLRELIACHKDSVRVLFWPEPRIMLNLNAPKDLFETRP